MYRLYSIFPADAAGAGLLILRFYVANLLLELGKAGTGEHVSKTLTILILTACLCLGAYTPAACLLSLAFGLACTHGAISPRSEVLHAAVIVSLMLLGPGAYSVDARRYGRRRILLRSH